MVGAGRAGCAVQRVRLAGEAIAQQLQTAHTRVGLLIVSQLGIAAGVAVAVRPIPDEVAGAARTLVRTWSRARGAARVAGQASVGRGVGVEGIVAGKTLGEGWIGQVELAGYAVSYQSGAQHAALGGAREEELSSIIAGAVG